MVGLPSSFLPLTQGCLNHEKQNNKSSNLVGMLSPAVHHMCPKKAWTEAVWIAGCAVLPEMGVRDWVQITRGQTETHSKIIPTININ